MSNEIDWSKAPEGCTHWEPSSDGVVASWMRREGGSWLYWPPLLPGSGRPCWVMVGAICDNRVARFIPRPVEWSGAGLPPVGIECEHQRIIADDCSWFPVLLLAHAKVDDRYVAVFQRTDDDIEISFSDAVFFRPIMTAEEIAAEEREREIDELVETIVTHYEYPKGAESYIGLAKALHSAGYRKTEQEQDQ